MSQEEGGDGETFKLNRRRIYLHRLVGDDVLQPRTKSSRRTSWRVILFALYFFIAVFTIHTRSRVSTLSDVNVGIAQALQSEPWKLEPVKKDFNDIRTIQDMVMWLDVAIIRKVITTNTYSKNLSLLSFNRIVSLKGVCPESAAILMTLRRMNTTTKMGDTTTDRFHPLYPRAWMASQLDPGTRGGDFEQTAPLKSTIDPNVVWYHTKRCPVDCDKELTFGYEDEGGYVAMMTLNEQEGSLVHLINSTAEKITDADQSICGEIRRSAVVKFDDFIKSGFLDETFGSLALEFVMYNANLQSMTDVLVTVSADNMGLITNKMISTKSIELILEHELIKYFEVSYLILTAIYFFEFCYRAYRFYPNFFLEVWSYINFIGIVSSLISLTLWYVYMPILQDFLIKDDFGQPYKLRRLVGYTQWYLRASAIATLTISLRTIQFLGETNSRVKLLLTTLGISAKNMILYISYIGVIWAGFLAFAFIRFSGKSPHFITFPASMLSCFELFLGNNVSLKDLSDTYKVPFFIFFTLVFYFISVQMFNAIINYAYNLVSEQMNPQFEHESRERKRKEMQRLNVNKNMFQQVMDSVRQLPWMSKPDDVAKDKTAAESDQKKGGLDDADDKEKAEHFGRKDKKNVSSESCSRMGLFLIFAISYIWFLFVNFDVAGSAAVKDSLLGAIKTQEVGVNMEVEETIGNGTRSMTRYIDWTVVKTLPQVTAWMYGSLVSIMFNTTSQESVQAATGAVTPVCMKNWNCVIQQTSSTSPPASNAASLSTSQASAHASIDANNTNNASHGSLTASKPEPSILPVSPPWAQDSGKALIRITQRRSKSLENLGATTPEDIAADWAFSGGEDETRKQNRSKLLVPKRLGDTPPEVSGSPSDDEDVDPNFFLDVNGRPVCRSKKVGEGGFADNGGIVCMLDANYGTFVKQMRAMFEANFFTTESSTFVVDFVAYNGNQNFLVYVLVSFRVRASGVVEKTANVSTMKLFDFGTFFDDAWPIVLRLFPGIVYIALVAKFMYDLVCDLNQECYRKHLSVGNTKLATTVEFFVGDIFNALEIGSIGISLVSAVLFVLWLAKDGQLESMLQRDQEDLINYASHLASQNKLYNNLSAVNVLIIFVRPLKFLRGNIRMANLYETLYEAKTDICWFVVMFSVTLFGFVMFAHVCFGPSFSRCRDFPGTLAYCFNYVLGNFDVTPLLQADGLMAVLFFVPFLLLFYCVFLNIFFAIIDRHFMPAEPPPFNWRRYLKPIFGRICRCIEWDEDYAMEQEPKTKDGDTGDGEASLTRQGKVKKTQIRLQEIEDKARENVLSLCPKNSKILSEVCDLDERMSDVLQWSREEAQRLVTDFQKLLNRKHSVKNDDVFIKGEIRRLKDDSKQFRDEMMDAERHMRYSTKVHEQMAQRDQETLAKYVLLLENKIKAKMGEKHALETEVNHLKLECDHMRFTQEELKAHDESNLTMGFDSGNALGDRHANEPEDQGEPVDQLALVEDSRASGAAGGVGSSDQQALQESEAFSEKTAKSLGRPGKAIEGLGGESGTKETREQRRHEKNAMLFEARA